MKFFFRFKMEFDDVFRNDRKKTIPTVYFMVHTNVILIVPRNERLAKVFRFLRYNLLFSYFLIRLFRLQRKTFLLFLFQVYYFSSFFFSLRFLCRRFFTDVSSDFRQIFINNFLSFEFCTSF